MSTKTALQTLASASLQLNKKSDTLNDVISSLNNKLEAMEVGLEVWLTDRPVKSEDSYSTYGPTDHNQEHPIPEREVTLLGYTRIDKKWVLAVKSATLTTKQNQWGREYEQITDSSRLRPLLDASRQTRMLAMPLVPLLLEALEKKVQAAVEGIEAAAKAAAEL